MSHLSFNLRTHQISSTRIAVPARNPAISPMNRAPQVHEAMTYLTLYGYNFCWTMRTLWIQIEDGRWQERTPAMAAGLTDHAWNWPEWFMRPAAQSRRNTTDDEISNE